MSVITVLFTRYCWGDRRDGHVACMVERLLVKHQGHEATICRHLVFKLGILKLYLHSTYIFLHAAVLNQDQSAALTNTCIANKTNYIHIQSYCTN